MILLYNYIQPKTTSRSKSTSSGPAAYYTSSSTKNPSGQGTELLRPSLRAVLDSAGGRAWVARLSRVTSDNGGKAICIPAVATDVSLLATRDPILQIVHDGRLSTCGQVIVASLVDERVGCVVLTAV